MKTGSALCADALKEIQVIDPTAAISAEQQTDALSAANDLLDLWRTKRLLVAGITINTYSLVSGTASYTIGSGGVFDQAYPQRIERWSVIPDDDATDPQEMSMGRPVTSDVWQGIRVKTQTGSRPTTLYYDRLYAAGLGLCYFHPVPDNNDVDVKLYCAIPSITALVAGTTYDLQPGMQNALTLGLALALGRGRYGKSAVMTADLKEAAREALAAVMGANIVPKESPMRPEYAIGSGGRRNFNIYTG